MRATGGSGESPIWRVGLNHSGDLLLTDDDDPGDVFKKARFESSMSGDVVVLLAKAASQPRREL